MTHHHPSARPVRRWLRRAATLTVLCSAVGVGVDAVPSLSIPGVLGGADRAERVMAPSPTTTAAGGTGATAGDGRIDAAPTATRTASSEPTAVTGTTGAAVGSDPSLDEAPVRTPTHPPCTVGPVPRTLQLDSYYTKACVVMGLPVVGSAAVDDAALVAAAEVVAGMLQARPDLVRAMADGHFRLGVIDSDARAVDLPEYRDLPTSYPDIDWDAARAYGATPRRPLAAVPEENLVCAADDTYPGQSVLTHELGHSVLDMAVIPGDPRFADRIDAAFRAAARLEVYRDTYAMTNVDEYWAEGVQDFFDASREGHGSDGGGDGYDGPIASRQSLRQQDPTLYALIAEVFTEVPFAPRCPSGAPVTAPRSG